ncbi:MAG: prepilin-type N-terminal cleavage/methylation domain-containing protein [Desulfitobacteriia bacterium]|jgi:type II secretory pathway component PulJ
MSRWKGKRLQDRERGLTLLEVLLSLVLTGVIAGVVLMFYISHYRLAVQVRTESELEYSLVRAGQVLASAVRSGNRINWSKGILTISYRQVDEKVIEDQYYLADKDLNGIQDLYREHLNVPNPIASGLSAFTCTEIQKGLWKISLKAREGEKEICWERIVKQKVFWE